MGDLDAAEPGGRLDDLAEGRVDREAVVLARDLDLAGRRVEHRLVDAAVTERQLVRAEAERTAEQLVAEADAEERATGLQAVLQEFDLGVARGRVAGAVRVEERVGVEGFEGLGRDVLGHDVHLEPALGEVPGGRGLHTEVEHGQPADLLADRGDHVGLGGGHDRGEARPGHAGLLADGSELLVRRQVRVGAAEHAALHGTGVTDPTGERPGVDAGDAHDAVTDEVVVERRVRAVVRHDAARVAHHVPGHPDAAGLGVLVVHTRVADVRRGLHHDLPGVGRVGQRLLVPGHAGREDHLTQGSASSAVRPSVVAGAVLEDQYGPFACHQFVPSPAVCGCSCFVVGPCRAASAAAASPSGNRK